MQITLLQGVHLQLRLHRPTWDRDPHADTNPQASCKHLYPVSHIAFTPNLNVLNASYPYMEFSVRNSTTDGITAWLAAPSWHSYAPGYYSRKFRVLVHEANNFRFLGMTVGTIQSPYSVYRKSSNSYVHLIRAYSCEPSERTRIKSYGFSHDGLTIHILCEFT